MFSKTDGGSVGLMDWAGKRLVIFGCGYLGARVAREAVTRGMRITALTRNAAQAEQLGQMGIHQVITSQIESPEWHPLIAPQQDLILNCVSSAGGGWEGYRKSYLEGMHSIVQWASGGAIGTFIFTSSTSVYAQNNEEWVTEADPAAGSSEGARILREAEVLLEEKPVGWDRSFVLRLGGIYGPGRHHLLTRAGADYTVAEGDDIFLNPIHVDDAAAAIWAAAGADRVDGGIFNVVDNAPARKGEIVRYLAGELRRRKLRWSEVNRAVAGAGRGGVRPNRRISNRKARELLRWSPAYPDYRAGYASLLESR